MKFLFSIFLALLCLSCSLESDAFFCESGYGYMYKDGKEFKCPFTFRVRNAQREWEEVKNPRIITKDANNYEPLRLQNSWSMYNIFSRSL